MSNPRSPCVLAGLATIVITAVIGCTGSASSGQVPGAGAPMTKLSQFDKARYCDLAAGPGGSLHAIFTEQAPSSSITYLYYRASTDGGRTWSAAKNLSDDESGHEASYGRIIADTQGRVYAVWKYLGRGTILDGPGGFAAGDLTFRVLEGGTWSPRMLLGDDKVPTFSWFATKDPTGAVQVIWSQSPKDAAAAVPNSGNNTAALVRQARLNGRLAPAPIDLIVPRPLLTLQEQAAMTAAGHYPPREDTRPHETGLINLSGYVDAAGKAHFVGEDPGVNDGGRRLVLWNGTARSVLHTYDLFDPPQTYKNPPGLVADAEGHDHLIRMPERTETPTVRDYPIENGALGDPVDVLGPASSKGSIVAWQVSSLPGGQMVVTAGISEQGIWNLNDAELLMSIRDAHGLWSRPMTLTQNAAHQRSTHTDTGLASSVGESVTYSPQFAAVILDAGGHPCALMVNVEDTKLGLGGPVLVGGNVVSSVGSEKVNSPMVFFRRW